MSGDASLECTYDLEEGWAKMFNVKFPDQCVLITLDEDERDIDDFHDRLYQFYAETYLK